MGTIWVREFTGGLDTRRMPATTSGGVLIKAVDGHINRGGEFEKRAAFVHKYRLPANVTKGLAAGKSGLFVFGDAAPPTMPSGVTYQRLQHPDGSTALSRVLSYDLYAGKIYVAVEFADGSRYHFYDGVRVPAWYDGRARASFSVTAGGPQPAVAATGSFEVTGGTANPGVNRIVNITIDGVSLINAPVDHTGNNATTAAALATATTTHTSTPDYTASVVGTTVTITAATAGAAINGKAIIVTVGGDATVGNVQNMAGGVDATTSRLDSLTVDGVAIISSPVTWTTSNSNTAGLIASAINSFTSTPNYSATAVGDNVNIVAENTGTAANGKAVGFTLTAGFAVSPSGGLVMAGGVDPIDAASATGSFQITGGTAGAGNQITNITIDGVAIISSPVAWATSNNATATAVASAINTLVSSPNYSATASGNTVTVTASNTGPGVNGKSITISVGGNVTVGSVQAMSGGRDAEAQFVPGTFVRTIGSRMHSVSGPNEHFSGLSEPTRWTTEALGAGFIDMSTQSSGSEELTALAKYQQFVAVFAERTIQIWFFDSDPEQNAQRQVLFNTGTSSPLSVTQFGDNDLFYVDESGLRSLRARDSSNAAATTDIGVPIDTLVTEKLRSLTETERGRVVGLIEPREGRFWLVMKDEIFVFSFFGGAKISAWTTYSTSAVQPGLTEGAPATTVTLNITDAVVFNRKAYVRSGNDIYVFGGDGAELTYDDLEAEAWLPYLDAESPTIKKKLGGVDAAVEGSWEVSVAMDPNNLSTSDRIAIAFRTTYNDPNIAAMGESTHFSLRFKSKGFGAAKLGAAVIHFTGGPDEVK
jgi:hypothetical protein